MTETNSVSGRRVRTNSVLSRRPWVSTGMKSTSKPRRSRSLPTSYTAGCSTAVVMMWRRSGLAAIVPKRAVLLLSDAQEVKRISWGRTFPSSLAIVHRAWAMASAGPRAASYIELGLKYSPVRKGIIASTTSGATAVVALLSR